MKKARIIEKRNPRCPSREGRLELRSGRKGTGRLLGAVNFWPDSSRSCDAADRIIYEIADREGVAVHED